MIAEIKDSAYWQSEINKTQEYLAELIHGELAGVKSTKSADDTITMQDISSEIEKCKYYLSYCETKLKEALEQEEGNKKESKSILYFNREFGY